jgi:hypothetical protein
MRNKTQRNIIEYIHFLELTPGERRILLRKFTTKPLLFKVIKKQSIGKLIGFEGGLLCFNFFSIHGEKEAKVMLKKAHNLLQKINHQVYQRIKREIKNKKIENLRNSPEYIAKVAALKIETEQKLTNTKNINKMLSNVSVEKKGGFSKRTKTKKKKKIISPPIKPIGRIYKDIQESREKLAHAALQKRMRDSMPD